ncbi:M15 family metallopeptidase [Anthocerotibacter panamensis]|uniref:M15 family metallopeptidase n=1 Tax=Anthocerotibacter panamensis TaxID=2857077 RepID=UPI001C4074B9|nr:M15 family metallopeptidase [Anthocerotibacter panamensis]
MNDLPEIPTARREYTPPRPTKPPSYAGRQRLVVLGALLLGVGVGGLWFLVFQGNARTPAATAAAPSTTVAEVPSLDAPSADPGLLSHHPYAVAPQSELTAISRSPEKTVYLRDSAARQYTRMAAAARRDGVVLVPISGFRDLKYQENLFNRNVVRYGGVEEARKISAPPGYSEHHTGYALDLGDGKAPNTTLQASFERTAAFRWLKANAKRYSFEISFDRGNPQAVSYEPWHWRFIGDKGSLETFYGNSFTNEQPSDTP